MTSSTVRNSTTILRPELSTNTRPPEIRQITSPRQANEFKWDPNRKKPFVQSAVCRWTKNIVGSTTTSNITSSVRSTSVESISLRLPRLRTTLWSERLRLSPPANRCTRLVLAFFDYRTCADYLFPAEVTPSGKMTRINKAESRGEFVVFGIARFETAAKGRDD